MPDSFDYQDILKYISLPNILDNLDVGVNINDAEGRFLFVNMVTVNWRNIPRKEFLKMNVHDFSPTILRIRFGLSGKTAGQPSAILPQFTAGRWHTSDAHYDGDAHSG